MKHISTRGRARRHAWPLVIVTALLLSACGNDTGSGPTEAPTTPPPATQEPSSPDPTTDEETDPEVALDYYDDKNITILVGVNPGGAVDTTARFWAEWLPRYLEGNPSVIIENMPGASHVIASNYFDLQVEQDGTTLMIQASPGHFSWRVGVTGVEFDVGNWEPLIASPGGDIWYANPESTGIETLDDLVTGNHNDLFFAGQQPSGSDLFKIWAFHVLDIPVHATWGYAGRGPGRIAFEQGEANIDVQSSSAYPSCCEEEIESGVSIPLFTMGQNTADGSTVRDEFWPDIPHLAEVYEMIHGEPPSGPMWEAAILGGALGRGLGRTLYVHNDAPEEAKAALRDAFERMAQDPEYIEAAFETLGPYTNHVGQEVRDLVRTSLVEIDDSVIDFMVDFVAETYDTDLREGED